MADYKINIELVQQTPIIHFQHDHRGATLRASEVKPKLDRFLIKKLGGFDRVWDEHPEWFAGYTKKAKKSEFEKKPALDYKMRFFANGEPVKSQTIIAKQEADREGEKVNDVFRNKGYRNINSFYFGNMAPEGVSVENVYKETVFYPDGVRLEILCFHMGLKAAISEALDEFFLMHNFGTRQTKGFGGFAPQTLTAKKAIEILNNNGAYYFYTDSSGDADRLMDQAIAIYNVMKSGINMTGYDKRNGNYKNPGGYIKGYAVREYLPGDTGSDKAYIKGKVFPGRKRSNESGEPKDTYASYTFIRAVLGLASFYEFKDDMRKGTIVVKNYDGVEDADGRITVSAENIKEDKGIQRFSSPFLIKILDGRIVFILNDSYKVMLNKRFFVGEKKLFDKKTEMAKRAGKKDRIDMSDIKYIYTPREFDPEMFIKGFAAYFNKNAHKLELCRNPYRKSVKLKLETGGGAK